MSHTLGRTPTPQNGQVRSEITCDTPSHFKTSRFYGISHESDSFGTLQRNVGSIFPKSKAFERYFFTALALSKSKVWHLHGMDVSPLSVRIPQARLRTFKRHIAEACEKGVFLRNLNQPPACHPKCSAASRAASRVSSALDPNKVAKVSKSSSGGPLSMMFRILSLSPSVNKFLKERGRESIT